MSSIIEVLRVVAGGVVLLFGWAPAESPVGQASGVAGVVSEAADLVGLDLAIRVGGAEGNRPDLGLGEGLDVETLDQGSGTGSTLPSLAGELDEELLDQGAPPGERDDEPLDGRGLADELDEETLDAGLPPLIEPRAGESRSLADQRIPRASREADVVAQDDAPAALAAGGASGDGSASDGDGNGRNGGGRAGGGGGGRTTGGNGDAAADGGGGGGESSADGARTASGERSGGGPVVAGTVPEDLGDLARCHVVASAGRALVAIGCGDGRGVYAGFDRPPELGGLGDDAGAGAAESSAAGNGSTREGRRGAGDAGVVRDEGTSVETVDVDIDARGGRETEDDRGRNGQGDRETRSGDAGTVETGDLPDSVVSEQAAPDPRGPGGEPARGRDRDRVREERRRIRLEQAAPADGRAGGEIDRGAPAENVAYDAPPLDGIGFDRLTVEPELGEGTRYDDPVLRFLPEIEAAAADAGIPPALLAAAVRVTSAGEPAAVFPDGGVGLAKVPAPEMVARGIEPAAWFDPATNLDVAAEQLAGYLGPGENPALALTAYLGETGYCNPADACQPGYAEEWYGYYGAVLAEPGAADLDRLGRLRLAAFSPDPVGSLAEPGAPPAVHAAPQEERRGSGRAAADDTAPGAIEILPEDGERVEAAQTAEPGGGETAGTEATEGAAGGGPSIEERVLESLNGIADEPDEAAVPTDPPAAGGGQGGRDGGQRQDGGGGRQERDQERPQREAKG